MFPSQFANIFLTFVAHLHQLRVELRCKLQEKVSKSYLSVFCSTVALLRYTTCLKTCDAIQT